MHRADDLTAVDALKVDAGDPEVGVSQLPLNHHERNPLVRHLDSVCVPQLMWREAAPDASCGGPLMQLFARG